MNPNCGNTDRVVNSSDNTQICDDLSAVIFLSVGRILLEKNSLTYIKMFFPIFNSIKFYISTRLIHIAWSGVSAADLGSNLLSRYCSTIGAHSLNFSVRNGKR